MRRRSNTTRAAEIFHRDHVQVSLTDLIATLKYIQGAGGSLDLDFKNDGNRNFAIIHPQVAEALVSALKMAPARPKAPKRVKPPVPLIGEEDPGKGL